MVLLLLFTLVVLSLSHWLFEVVMHCLKVKPPASAMPQHKKVRLRTVFPQKKIITNRSK